MELLNDNHNNNNNNNKEKYIRTQAPTKDKAYNTCGSQAVTHPSTWQARRCLTSVIRREPVHSAWYGRRHQKLVFIALYNTMHSTVLCRSQHQQLTPWMLEWIHPKYTQSDDMAIPRMGLLEEKRSGGHSRLNLSGS